MRTIWTQIITGLAYSLLLIFLFLLAQCATTFLLNTYVAESFTDNHFFASMLLSYTVFYSILVLVNHIEKRSFLEHYKHFDWTTLKGIVIEGGILIMAIQGISFCIEPLFPEYTTQMAMLLRTDEPMLQFFVIVMIAPLVEEYLFREKIQTFLVGVLGVKAGIILQAILFAGLHGFLLQRIYTLLLGLGLGAVRYRFKHMVAPTLIHIFFNVIGFL